MTAIERDPYAKRRGKLFPSHELAIIALGNYDKPLHEDDVKAVVGGRAILVQLEDRGYAFTPHTGKYVKFWMLTNSGIEQCRRLKGIKS